MRVKRKKNSRIQSSQDLNTQNAHLGNGRADSLTWNNIAEAYPRFGNTLRLDGRVHDIIQLSENIAVATSSPTIPVLYTKSFTISGLLADFTTFAGVFDQYRIREVECWITADTVNDPNLQGNVDFINVVDYDDAIVPASFGVLFGYTNMILSNTRNGHYFKFRPHMATAVYSGAFTSFKNEVADWIDVASPNVQHYGLKGAIGAVSNTFTVNMKFRIHVQFRNTW